MHTDGDLARAHQRASRREFPLALLGEQPLGRLARLALVAQIAAALDHAAQNVVGELDAAHVEPLLDSQQAPVDEDGECAGRRAGSLEAAEQPLLRDILAKARTRSADRPR